MSEYAEIKIGKLSLCWFRNYLDKDIVRLFFSKNDLVVIPNENVDDCDEEEGTYNKNLYKTTVQCAKERLDAYGFSLSNMEKIFNDKMTQAVDYSSFLYHLFGDYDEEDKRNQIRMAMVPFMRGYAHISLDPNDRYGQLSNIMHGYGAGSLDVIPIYNSLFGNVFNGSEIISVSDILSINCNNLDILDETLFPLLADTLEQTLVYYHLRMKVEKELVDIFSIHTNDTTMLNQIIQRAFRCQNAAPNYEQMREFRVFFTSRKTLLNEFNHFEGNMNIFQPAIDITKSALQKEIDEIEAKLTEVRLSVSV